VLLENVATLKLQGPTHAKSNPYISIKTSLLAINQPPKTDQENGEVERIIKIKWIFLNIFHARVKYSLE
jgi:hypothetical protein